MAAARRTWLFTLCLWLSLATVLGHALAPIGSPLAQKSGSAFSASTWDVSLAAPRAGLNAKLKRGQAAPDDELQNGPDLPGPGLLAAAPSLPEPAPGRPAFAFLSQDAAAPFGPGGGFHARAPPRA
ncbi:MAG TPA: hypothetical protein VMG08_07750 [Allosphingosinicella sp.]|nr:hypothetical protein [Allosphingosinicella sp.]